MPRFKQPILIALIGIVIGEKSSLALQTYPLIDHQSTTLTISQTELNRISVIHDRIQQVFGAEGTFDVQSDEEGGQIFLKVTSGSDLASHLTKPSTITIITESGLTQDLRLVPKAIAFQSILFKPQAAPQEEIKKQSDNPDQLQAILPLMKGMVRNETIEGYIKSPSEQKSFCLALPLEDFLASEEKSAEKGHTTCAFSKSTALKSYLSESLKNALLFIYKGEQFEGKIYLLTNQGEESLYLKEQDFALQDDVAIALSRTTLHPQETATLYMISRRGLQGKPEGIGPIALHHREGDHQ